MEYSKEITDLFLIRYRKLEQIQKNQPSKYQYIKRNHSSDIELFRHIRNNLSHNEVDSNYPFIVSKSVLDKIELILKEVEEKAFKYCVKGNDLSYVYLNTSFNKVISIMSKHHYSYLPIVDNKHVVKGIISGDSIIDLLNEGRIKAESIVSDYMDEFTIDDNENAFFIFINKNIYFYEL